MTTLTTLSPPTQHLLEVADAFRPGELSTGANLSPLRITHLGKFFHPAHGGIERTVRSLAHAQAKIGCSVRVICMDHERGRATHVEQDGPVEVVRVRARGEFLQVRPLPRPGAVDPRFRGRPARTCTPRIRR